MSEIKATPARRGKTKSAKRAPTTVAPAAGRPRAAGRKANGATNPVREAAQTARARMAKGSVAGLEQGLLGGYEQLAELGAENVKAVVTAGNVLAQGIEALSREVSVYARDSITAGFDAVRDLSECKTVAEAFDQQSAFARDSFDTFVAETEKLSGMSAKLAKEAFEPINARISAAADTLIKGTAA